MSEPTPALQSASAPAGRISYEAFLERYNGQHAEWIDGNVMITPPVSSTHARLTAYLLVLLSGYASLKEQGEVFITPFNMKLAEQKRGREPDLMFVSAAHADRVKANFLEGPADLAIEIVSPESDQRDRIRKFGEYQAGGVTEYWIIDPAYHEALFYRLGDDQKYHRIAPDASGDFHCAVLSGFKLHVQTLWAERLPGILEIADLIRHMAAQPSNPDPLPKSGE